MAVELRPGLAGAQRFFKRFGRASFYLLATLGLGFFGWYLQHIAFTPPPPAGQMYAAVFVRDPAAHVSLTTVIDPNQPWIDSWTVNVSDVSPEQPGWLLVIECPANAPSQSSAVPIESETVPNTQSPVTMATVYSGVSNPRPNMKLHCFAPPESAAGKLGTSGSSSSLANVTLSALQLDQGMVGAGGSSHLVRTAKASWWPCRSPHPGISRRGVLIAHTRAGPSNCEPRSHISTIYVAVTIADGYRVS